MVEVNKFQYPGSTLNTEMTYITEIKKKLATATTQLANCDKLWRATNIDMKIKAKLMRSLITSIALYGCETRTYSRNIEKRLEAFERRCCRRLINITWNDRVGNDEVDDRMKAHLGNLIPLLVTARRRTLQWFGRTTRRTDSLAQTVIHGLWIVKEVEDGQRRLGWMTSSCDSD